jgi:ParB-like chromosome segregation protein Spo0J
MAKKFVMQEEEAKDSRFTKGMKFSSKVEYVDPKKLSPNKLNTEFFADNNVDMQKLKDDIFKNGITTPLLVKKDKKTILAGHTRLKVALELGLESVPVQFSEFELSEEQERKFIVSDNLLRRQLNDQQRMNLYRVLFPDIDTLLDEKKETGRPKKGALTITKIAEETGQKSETVRKQFQRARTKKRDTVPLLKSGKVKNSTQEKRDSVPLLDREPSAMPQLAKKQMIQAIAMIENVLDELSEKDRTTYGKKLESLAERLANFVVI